MATPEELAAAALQEKHDKLAKDIVDVKAVVADRNIRIKDLLDKYEPRTAIAPTVISVTPTWIVALLVIIGMLVPQLP
jgi:hypothetical protein